MPLRPMKPFCHTSSARQHPSINPDFFRKCKNWTFVILKPGSHPRPLQLTRSDTLSDFHVLLTFKKNKFGFFLLCLPQKVINSQIFNLTNGRKTSTVPDFKIYTVIYSCTRLSNEIKNRSRKMHRPSLRCVAIFII